MPPIEEIHQAVECLQKLTDLFRQRRQALAHGVGLTEQQWSVLEEVATDHFMPSLFAKQSERTAASVSKVLRQLLDKEVIVVSLNADDGRQRKYELSQRGAQLLAELRQQREHAIAAVWQPFDSNDIRQFARFSTQLIKSLEEYGGDSTALPVKKLARVRHSAPLEDRK